MVTVGVLAALINIIVLFVVAIADRAIELIVRNFATSRLINHRRAPVVHDSDTWLPFLPRSVIKYHRHPGVDVSKTCKPAAESGRVIAPGGITNSFTDIELSGTCFLLQGLAFDEGELKRVRAGIPRRLDGRECFKCIDARSPDIVSDCKVRDLEGYEPGELNISITTTQGTFKTITSSFQETNGNQTLFEGYGDLTFNGHEISTFLFHKHLDNKLWYFEYNHQDHLNIMKGLAPNQIGTPVTEPTKGLVHLSEIACTTNVLDIGNFSEVIRMYRTVQLENPITPAHLDPQTHKFDPITPAAIYRAVLAAKIIDDVHEDDGVFYRYTSCGKYNWSFLFPMIICLAILLMLGIASHIFRPSRLSSFHIPFNSRSWYHHARNREDMSSPYQEERKRKSGYFGNIFDELKLVDDDEDTLPNGRLILSTRDDHVAREPSRFIGTGHMDSSAFSVEALQRNP
ncbi:hypothetical protein FGB62_254g08 [Gracilaria domingensis]|nr:hypothetical protein FGB62_254g08 [Gracilaria domingensis]